MLVRHRPLEPAQELGVALAGVAAVVDAGHLHVPRQDVAGVLAGVDTHRDRGYRNHRPLH